MTDPFGRGGRQLLTDLHLPAISQGRLEANLRARTRHLTDGEGIRLLPAADVGIRLIRNASSILTGISPQTGPFGQVGPVEHEMGERGGLRGHRTSDQQVGGSNPSGRATSAPF
jgi:hypothetical protein